MSEHTNIVAQDQLQDNLQDDLHDKLQDKNDMVECPAELGKSSVAVPIDWNNLKADTSFSDAARKRVLSWAASSNKSTYRKVEEAIAMIGTSDTGASVSAILTWILNNYTTLDPTKLKVNVKRAVLKGLKGGRLVRAKTCKKAQGVTGSFTFPAQRIKLKAVRLEGKKYVFPILQPISSTSATGDGTPQVAETSIKRRMSLDDIKPSPKRLPKNRAKRAISEMSNSNLE